MSTRCQIEFRSGDVRRTVYRHSDGYPSAVIEDLLAFLAWSVRGSDVEYVAANFLYWSKREITKCFPRHEQLGFGICGNDELHGDIQYYYIVAWEEAGVRITAHAIAHDAGDVRLGRVVRSAVYTPPARQESPPSATFFNSAADTRAMDGVRALPMVQLNASGTFETIGYASFAASTTRTSESRLMNCWTPAERARTFPRACAERTRQDGVEESVCGAHERPVLFASGTSHGWK